MVINHLLTGMVLQVWDFPEVFLDKKNMAPKTLDHWHGEKPPSTPSTAHLFCHAFCLFFFNLKGKSYQWLSWEMYRASVKPRIPGNSAGDLFGMVSSRDPNSKVVNVTKPTFGDKVWSWIESPGKQFKFKNHIFAWPWNLLSQMAILLSPGFQKGHAMEWILEGFYTIPNHHRKLQKLSALKGRNVNQPVLFAKNSPFLMRPHLQN